MKQKFRLILKWIFKLIIALAVFISILSIPFLIAFKSWTLLKCILIFVGVAVYIQIHRAIIKKKKIEWYRWIVNSLIYRHNVYVFKRKFRNLSYTFKIRFHTDEIIRRVDDPRWYDKYWFGRGLDNVLNNEMIKWHNEQG